MHEPQEPVLDLFGEVRITTHDVDAWLRAVPRIDPASPRAALYVQQWAVVDKIRRTKMDGTFDAITRPRHAPGAHWVQRFGWAIGQQ